MRTVLNGRAPTQPPQKQFKSYSGPRLTEKFQPKTVTSGLLLILSQSNYLPTVYPETCAHPHFSPAAALSITFVLCVFCILVWLCLRC